MWNTIPRYTCTLWLKQYHTVYHVTPYTTSYVYGAWWLICRFVTFRPKGRGFEFRSSRHVGILGKSFTRSCLWRCGVKFRHSISAVLGAPQSSGGLWRGAIEMAWMNEWSHSVVYHVASFSMPLIDSMSVVTASSVRLPWRTSAVSAVEMDRPARRFEVESTKQWNGKPVTVSLSLNSHSFTDSLIHSFIHSIYLYSASSSPLLLRGTPDYSFDTVLELIRRSATGNCEWRTCPRYLRGG